MSEKIAFNALVINSNLAQHITKKRKVSNPGSYSRDRYCPRPAIDLDQRPHLVVPEAELEDTLYSVYGFLIPDTIRLRVVEHAVDAQSLSSRQKSAAEQLARLGHGIALEINDPEQVSMNSTLNADGSWGRAWSVQGEATSSHLNEPITVKATGIRGHAVASDPGFAGKALIENR